jgi:2-methylisocitrate lyase-like PEP mutase family enzyme
MAERKRMTTRFKELFEQKQFFVMAGGMNPIGARMAEVLGYEVFYMSGGNTSAHQLGWPDSGNSMRDMVDNARKIVLTVNIPVFFRCRHWLRRRGQHVPHGAGVYSSRHRRMSH